MNKKLGDIAQYSSEKILLEDLSLEDYVTTDSLKQEKKGRELATNLPPGVGSAVKFENGDILVSNIRPYLKKIWFADCIGGNSADVLTFKVDSSFNSKFVYYSLFRDDFFEHMMRGSKGTKMPRGDKDQILDFPVPDFSYDKQEKIAKVLSDLDAKIELNNKINAELEAMAKLIYDYWFVQFDFPDENGKPYKSSGGKMVYNEELKREIPEGWEVKELSEVADFKHLCACIGCHAYEELFRRQRDAGTVLGPEGLDWPREDVTAPNEHGLNYMPDFIREQFDGTRTADGKMWPRPELVKVTPGDAVLVLHSCPHGASINTAADPRYMIYFRITSPLRGLR